MELRRSNMYLPRGNKIRSVLWEKTSKPVLKSSFSGLISALKTVKNWFYRLVFPETSPNISERPEPLLDLRSMNKAWFSSEIPREEIPVQPFRSQFSMAFPETDIKIPQPESKIEFEEFKPKKRIRPSKPKLTQKCMKSSFCQTEKEIVKDTSKRKPIKIPPEILPSYARKKFTDKDTFKEKLAKLYEQYLPSYTTIDDIRKEEREVEEFHDSPVKIPKSLGIKTSANTEKVNIYDTLDKSQVKRAERLIPSPEKINIYDTLDKNQGIRVENLKSVPEKINIYDTLDKSQGKIFENLKPGPEKINIYDTLDKDKKKQVENLNHHPELSSKKEDSNKNASIFGNPGTTSFPQKSSSLFGEQKLFPKSPADDPKDKKTETEHENKNKTENSKLFPSVSETSESKSLNLFKSGDSSSSNAFQGGFPSSNIPSTRQSSTINVMRAPIPEEDEAEFPTVSDGPISEPNIPGLLKSTSQEGKASTSPFSQLPGLAKNPSETNLQSSNQFLPRDMNSSSISNANPMSFPSMNQPNQDTLNDSQNGLPTLSNPSSNNPFLNTASVKTMDTPFLFRGESSQSSTPPVNNFPVFGNFTSNPPQINTFMPNNFLAQNQPQNIPQNPVGMFNNTGGSNPYVVKQDEPKNASIFSIGIIPKSQRQNK